MTMRSHKNDNKKCRINDLDITFNL